MQVEPVQNLPIGLLSLWALNAALGSGLNGHIMHAVTPVSGLEFLQLPGTTQQICFDWDPRAWLDGGTSAVSRPPITLCMAPPLAPAARKAPDEAETGALRSPSEG